MADACCKALRHSPFKAALERASYELPDFSGRDGLSRRWRWRAAERARL